MSVATRSEPWDCGSEGYGFNPRRPHPGTDRVAVTVAVKRPGCVHRVDTMTAPEPPRLPVAEPLPADWREQAARRERLDLDEAMLARDRLVATQCSKLRKGGGHHLVDRHGPVFLHVRGELDVYEPMHCDGVAPTVPGTRWIDVPCPAFEIDGDRYPPRVGRIEPKARRKRLMYKRART